MSAFENPVLLQCCQYITKRPNANNFSRYIKDYEFDLYVDGDVDALIDDIHYTISKGDFVFRKPGQHVEDFGNFNVYTLTLDFSGKVNVPPEKYLRHRKGTQQEPCHPDVFNNIPTLFSPSHYADLLTLYKQIIDCSFPNIVDIELQKSLTEEFLLLLLADAIHHNRTTKKKHITNYVEKACIYINRNYARDITLDDIAESTALNKNYLVRLFKEKLNTTPNRYLLEIRLLNARLMLLQTTDTVETIARQCGFNTNSYFIKCFKEKYKKTPLVYREDYNIK